MKRTEIKSKSVLNAPHFIQYISAAVEQISRDGWFLHYCWFHSETPYVSTLGERNTSAVSTFIPPYSMHRQERSP